MCMKNSYLVGSTVLSVVQLPLLDSKIVVSLRFRLIKLHLRHIDTGIFGKRQIGDISCNIARFQTVGRLAQASLAVNSVKSAASA